MKNNTLAMKAIDAMLANAASLKFMASEWEGAEFPEETYMAIHGLSDSIALEIEVLARAIREG